MPKLLGTLAQACAILAGLLLTAITLICVASIVGRNTTGWTLVGDFELVASTAGAAIALFLPLAQFKRGNIIVDFFTSRVPPRINARLDRLGALLLAAAMSLLAWRTAVGGLNAWSSGAGSMMLGFPEWIVYAFMWPPIVLTALIALVQAALGFGEAVPE